MFRFNGFLSLVQEMTADLYVKQCKYTEDLKE